MKIFIGIIDLEVYKQLWVYRKLKKLDKTILKKMNQGKIYYELLSKYSNLIRASTY